MSLLSKLTDCTWHVRSTASSQGARASLSRPVSQNLRALAYNPMQAYGDRLVHISKTLANFHFVGLAGTRQRQRRERATSTEVRNNVWEWQQLPRHHAIQFGFPPEHKNTSTGVTIAFDKKLFGIHNVADCRFPADKAIQGRVGFVRVVSGRLDYSLITAYFPVRKKADRYQSMSSNIVQFCQDMLQFRVPARGVPLLFCDLNDHLVVSSRRRSSGFTLTVKVKQWAV